MPGPSRHAQSGSHAYLAKALQPVLGFTSSSKVWDQLLVIVKMPNVVVAASSTLKDLHQQKLPTNKSLRVNWCWL